MSNVITVEAKLTGDAASMVAALRQATNAMQATQRAAQQGGGRGGLGALAGGAARAVGKVVKLGVAAAATGVAIGTGFAGAAVKSGLQRLEAIQDSTVALTHMLGSATKAADLTAKALKVVKGTPFAFPQFAEAARQLVAFGVQAEKVPKILQAVADSAAASGQGAEAVQGIVSALGDMQVAGKLTGEVVQSLGLAGVNATAILANGMHKSTAEVQDLQRKGLIPADQAMQMLVDGIENGSHGAAGDFKALAGAAQDLGKTVSGSIGNMKAGFARMGASWLKPFEDSFPKLLNSGVIPFLDALGAAGGRVTQKFADSGALEKFTGWIGKLTMALTPMDGSFSKMTKGIDGTGSGIATLITQFSPLIGALQIVGPALAEVVKQVGPKLGKALIDLAPSIAQLLLALIPLLPPLTELAITVIPLVTKAIILLLPTVKWLVQNFGDTTKMLSGLLGLFQGGPNAIGKFMGAAKSMTGVAAGVRDMLNFLIGTVTRVAVVIGVILGTAIRIGSRAFGAIGSSIHIAIGAFSATVGAIGRVAGAIGGFIGGAAAKLIGFFHSIPSRIGNLGGVLVSAGKALIGGFIRGIGSMVGAVGAAASKIVGKVANFFPHSPAKEGPFSGRGWTLYSGQALGQGFASGMDSSISAVRSSARSLMNAASSPNSTSALNAVGSFSAMRPSMMVGAGSVDRASATGGSGGSGGSGVVELGPQAMKLLRILAGKDTTVAIGDETIAASANRGTKQSVLSGRG